MSEKRIYPFVIPALALRGLVIFPGMLLHFDVGRKKSIYALNEAMAGDQEVLLLTQKDMRDDNPDEKDLYQVGCVAHIRQVIKLPGDNLRVLVEGLHRAKMLELMENESNFLARAAVLEETVPRAPKTMETALIRQARELFEKYAALSSKLSPDIVMEVMQSKSAGHLSDYLASNLAIPFEDKQMLLEELSPIKRLEKLIVILQSECDILALEREIQNRVREQIDENQREYYLREQIKAINSELSGGDSGADEWEEYRAQILKLKLPADSEEKLLKEAEKLSKMPPGSHEATVVRNYLDACIELPWNKFSKEKLDVEQAAKILDRDHYGLQKVKERILELVSVRRLSPELSGQILCLVGPPGVGKTSIAKSVARCLGRKYTRISLGGVRDEADIRGHRKTYIGAMPGRIIAAIKQAGSANPLILLDEVDKLGSDFRGDPSSALLEVLDAEQNFAFRDHYIEIPFDLSKVLFLTTANRIETIPAPLLDRMEIIELSSYTREEKFRIARQHLIKKQLRRHGLTAKVCKFKDDAIYELIDYYTREAGVRKLEREIASLCRKAAKQIVSGEKSAVNIDAEQVRQMLGVRRYKPEVLAQKNEVGVVNGLAWTSVGGEIMQLEAAVLEGTGKIELTGSLGDVMKESARAAVSYIRSRSRELGISEDFYRTKDIHIHATEGAVPKDGPSAGITMATALVSALTGKAVRSDVAMTGEITLRGRVLPIGGLKEKTMAAYRAGITTVILPAENEPDLEELDPVVRGALRFVPVEHVDHVLSVALAEPAFEQTSEQEKEQASSLVLPGSSPSVAVIAQ